MSLNCIRFAVFVLLWNRTTILFHYEALWDIKEFFRCCHLEFFWKFQLTLPQSFTPTIPYNTS